MTDLAAGMGVYFVAVAAIYVLFLGARAAVAKLAGIRGGLAPFGEAPLDQQSRAPVAARIALALAGPAAIYALVVVLSAVAIHQGGELTDESTLISPAPGGPAAEAGLQDGDRIKAVRGQPVASFDEIRSAIRDHAGERIEVVVERGGQSLSLPVTLGGIGAPFGGKLGVERLPEPVTIGAAFRSALPRPIEALAERLRPKPRLHADLVGPVGITRGVADSSRPSLAQRLLRMGSVAGVSTLDGYLLLALFLFPHRRKVTVAPLSLPPAQPRPWVRLGARIVDLAVFALGLGLVAFAANPDLIDAAGTSFLLLTIPIEATLLATWGTTPGKALLGVSVRDAGGGKLSFGAALRRAAAVWTFGLAANMSFILVTGLLSWRRARRRGATYWDALDGHRVDHDDPAAWRILVAVVVVILVVGFNVAVQYRVATHDLFDL